MFRLLLDIIVSARVVDGTEVHEHRSAFPLLSSVAGSAKVPKDARRNNPDFSKDPKLNRDTTEAHIRL